MTAIEVVTHRSWIARELATGTEHAVHHGFGLDIPAAASTSAWWMPAEHAARLMRSGVGLALSSPGPHWLPRLPDELAGRRVMAVRAGDLTAAALPDGWSKPAEAKIEQLPAAWRTGQQLADAIADAGIPDRSWLQWTSTRLSLSCEYRCYVLDGRVVASSVYLADGYTYYDMLDGGPAASRLDRPAEHRAAVAFAGLVADELGPGRQPAGYVLDVGHDSAVGRWVVVEANPAWCSAWYGCGIDAVADTIVRSCAPDPGWEWRPDPYLMERASRMSALPRRPSGLGRVAPA